MSRCFTMQRQGSIFAAQEITQNKTTTQDILNARACRVQDSSLMVQPRGSTATDTVITGSTAQEKNLSWPT